MTTTVHASIHLRGAPDGPHQLRSGKTFLYLGSDVVLHVSDPDDARALATLLLEAAHQLDEAAA